MDTRRRILDAALSLFSEKGYANVFVAEIADAVGIKAPSLYKHFAGKQEIFDAIVQEIRSGYDRQAAALSLNGSDALADAAVFAEASEEELVKKSEWFCERVARVMVALCETQGIVGRIVFHIGAGHVTNEIYLEGGWAYFDPRCGMFCVDESDRFLSVDEIVRDRDVIYRQPKWVTDYHAKYWSLDYRQHRNYHFCFSPYELQCIGDYSLADADKYNFEWVKPYSGTGNLRTPQERYAETGLMMLIR